MFTTLLDAINRHDTIDPHLTTILTDDAAYPNTQTSVHTYDPAGVNYVASLDQKTFIDTFCSVGWKENNNHFKGDARAYAKAIRQACLVLAKNGYQKEVSYKFARGSTNGRLYDSGPTQQLSSKLRSYLLPSTYRDIDMSNCHPQILHWVFNSLGYDCRYLEEYVTNRAEVIAKHGVSKTDIITFINQDKPRITGNKWVDPFCAEMKRNKQSLADIVAHEYNTSNRTNALSSKVTKLVCDIENRLLHVAMDTLDLPNPILIFDGFMVQQDKPFTPEQINSINVETGLLDIDWVEKEWVKPDIPKVEPPSSDRTYAIQKALFEQEYFVVENSGANYWADTAKGPVPISKQAFVDASAKFWYMGGDDTKRKKLFDAWLQDEHRRQYRSITYQPHAKHDPPDIPDDVLNTAKPFIFDYLPVDQRDPDASTKFDTLLRELSEDDEGAAYLRGWIAHMLQKPMERPQIMPTFKSHGGTGKDTFTLTITRMLGQIHCLTVANMDTVYGGFNSAIANKLYLTLNEVAGKDGVKHVEAVKNCLTVEDIVIVFKGKDPYLQPNIVRQCLFSNNANPLPVDSAVARRLLMNQVRADRQLPKTFFDAYYTKIDDLRWINSLASNLYDTDLSEFDVRRPPLTASLAAKIQSNVHVLHQVMQDIAEGTVTGGVFTKVPRMAGCVAMQRSDFNILYKERLKERYPLGHEAFLLEKRWMDSVFGAYNEIVFPNARKRFEGRQQTVVVIHQQRMVDGLKNRKEYTTRGGDDDDEEELSMA